MVATGCYKPTVNESETIRAAEHWCRQFEVPEAQAENSIRDFKSTSGTGLIRCASAAHGFPKFEKVGAAIGCEFRQVGISGAVRGRGRGGIPGFAPIERS